MRISDWSSDVCSSDLSGKVAGKRAQIIVITAACHRRESGEARCGGHADVIACRLRICFGCQKLRVVLDSKRHSFDRRSGKTRQGRWLFEIARGKANEAQIVLQAGVQLRE